MPRKRKAAVALYKKEKKFNRNPKKDYELPPRENALFEKYYKGLNLVPEDEWEDFYTTLQRTLPVTFRITGNKSESQEILQNIKGNFFSQLLDHKVDGVEIPPPKCLSWYPNEFAWQVDLSRKIVRSSEQLSRLHDFLVAETECGAISRQEAVSMIPPLVMDIQSHHTVLDMCAAPGSKTAQLIEYLHSSCKNGELPTGYVVANDSDNKRCYLMVHQVKRLQSPCCMIVNHDASIFPKIKTNSDENNPQFQLFDRILCDVPCSGDGTMRKNFDAWIKWHPLQGANLHGLQCKILRRGCQLLAKGGRLVYSTCSLNPVEDEAVVAELLRSTGGAMELVDISHELPGLKYTSGVSTWKVMTKTGEWIASQEEVPEGMKTQYKGTIFPPTEEEAKAFHLDKCIRILPHLQDTGGFFVAALRKVRHLPGSKEARAEEKKASATTEEEESKASDVQASSESVVEEGAAKAVPQVGEEPKQKKKKIFGCFKEDPFFFMETTDPIWPSLKNFFGMTDFPSDQIMFRSEQGKRTLYFVSKTMREMVRHNVNTVKFINMGVKSFSRSPSPLVPDCDFRISQECLQTLSSRLANRKVKVTKQDAIIILSEENPFTHKFSPDTQKQLEDMTPGSTMFLFSASDIDPSPKCDIVFCGWRGKTSVRCFGSKMERAHMLTLFGEDLKAINDQVQREKKANREKSKHGWQQDQISDDLPPLPEDKPEVKGDGDIGSGLEQAGDENGDEKMAPANQNEGEEEEEKNCEDNKG